MGKKTYKESTRKICAEARAFARGLKDQGCTRQQAADVLFRGEPDWDEALDALFNWCYNTKEHLDKARELKDLMDGAKRKVNVNLRSRWHSNTRNLLRGMLKELHEAEPDTLENIPYIPFTTEDRSFEIEFLEMIPAES